MKYVFLIAFLVLVCGAAGTYLTEPDLTSDVPVIYWTTDPNPARLEQVDLFHQWLIDNGHVTEDGRPIVELRLDTASAEATKKVIQSVAGVAGDIMDCDIGQLHSLGVLYDVTDLAEEHGFGIDQTYASLEPLLFQDGRQYGFPCNVANTALWGNRATFAKVGMDPPPRDWTIEEFEAIGREFVKRANPPGERQSVFFVNNISGGKGNALRTVMHRSLGLSIYNETMTAATTDDPRFAYVLEKVRQWTYDDNLAPSGAEEASFATQAGYGGVELPLFVEGQYAMIVAGRWALIRMRDFAEPTDIALSYYPMPADGFVNDLIGTRAAAVYKGGERPEVAALFLAFLASESYNRQIVTGADALPPNPAHADTEEFRRPAAFPNEWDVHETTLESARQRAIAPAVSPFVPAGSTGRLVSNAVQRVMANPPLATADEAAADLAMRIDREIELVIRESPTLKARYDELVGVQKKIEEYRAQGRPVPLEWITNPFHRAYYVKQGWAVSETEDELARAGAARNMPSNTGADS